MLAIKVMLHCLCRQSGVSGLLLNSIFTSANPVMTKARNSASIAIIVASAFRKQVFRETDLYVNHFFGVRKDISFVKDSGCPIRLQTFCGHLLYFVSGARSKLHISAHQGKGLVCQDREMDLVGIRDMLYMHVSEGIERCKKRTFIRSLSLLLSLNT